MPEFAPPSGPGDPPPQGPGYWPQGSGYPPRGPGYTYQPLPVKDGRRLRIVGRVLTVLGAIVLLLAGVGGGVTAYGGLKASAAPLLHQTHVDPRAEVTLAAGDEYQLFYPAGTTPDDGATTTVSSARGWTPTECTVTDPNGEAVDLADSTSTTVAADPTSWQSFASWTARDAGRYTISCDHDGLMAAPAFTSKNIVTGVVGVLVAVLGGIAGLVLLVAGIVCWAIGARRERERAALR